MKKYISIITLGLAISGLAQTQPIITGLDKKAGTANEVVSISGAGFVGTPLVFFGNGRSTSVNLINGNLLQVEVPASATSGPITVINQDGPPNLAATSSSYFTLAFDIDDAGQSFIPPAIGTAIPMGAFTYDLCLCDFDGDANGLLDVVVSSDDATDLNILRNTSTASSVSFIGSTLNNDGNTAHSLECGDLNGDGLPDLVVTSQGSGEPFVHIYQNNSTPGSISLTAAQTKLTLPTLDDGSQRLPKRVRLVDIDGDGLKDIVVGSASVNELFVYLNTSSASVSFSTSPTKVIIDGPLNAAAFYPGDFDNDGRIDLALIGSSTDGQVYILRNKSIPGKVILEVETSFGNIRTRINVVTGDFNNDGFIDIATSSSPTLNEVNVFENNGNLTFSESNYSVASTTSWGLDVADMNGDGLVDLLVAANSGHIIYFENNSSSSISFNNGLTRATTGPARNVKAGDINNDGKPDIVFTDNSRATGVIGEFNYIVNDLCMTPVITPTSAVFCIGDDFILTATGGEGVNYNWSISGDTPASVDTGTTNQLNLNDHGYDADISVTVTATSPDANCIVASNPANALTVSLAAGIGNPVISVANSGITCSGEDLVLIPSPTNASYQYFWTGPNGYTNQTDNSSPNATITDAATINSGIYTLYINDGNCDSPMGSVNVVISSPPVTTIESSNCDNGTFTLEVPDFDSQFDYQWKIGGVNVPSAGTTPVYTDSQVGVYTLDIVDDNLCIYTTDPYQVYTSSFTGPSFGSATDVCFNAVVTFTADQTGSGIANTWEVVQDPSGTPTINSFIGDQIDVTFNDLSPSTSTGDWEVRLFTTYSSPQTVGQGCASKPIAVVNNPTYAIEHNSVDNTGPLTKCPSENITLGFSEVGTNEILTVTWDSLGTEVVANTLIVNEPGTYTATYTTNTGCEEPVTLEVINHPDLGLTASDTEGVFNPTIVENELQLGDGQLSVTISTDMGVTGPSWSIVSGSGDAQLDVSGTSVLVSPKTPTVIIEVTGTTNEGCLETEQVLVIAGTFLARKSFSPNGDSLNDFWGIVNGSALTGCKVFILDTRGRTVFTADSPFDEVDGESQIWDGNFNGKEVPEGVYYFVLKCDENSNSQSGSILLAR